MRATFLVALIVCVGCKREPAPSTPPTTTDPDPIVAVGPDAAPAPTAPDCEAAIRRIAELRGYANDEAKIQTFTEACVSSGWSDAVIACAAGATEEAQVEPCLRPALGAEVAAQFLEMIRFAAATYAAGGKGFPVGTAGPIPAAPCCESADGLCHSEESDWAGIWKKIGFHAAGPNPFQFSYESKDGNTMQVSAIGDLDCDGTSVTFQLRGTWSKGHEATFETVAPDPTSD
jgi:hypothetical protein